VKTIVVGEELLVDYDLNRIDTGVVIMGVIIFYRYTQPLINVFFLYI
jgi:hypothetical protein